MFNVRTDPFVGKLCSFRVHQGTCTGTVSFTSAIQIGREKRPFKLGHVFNLQGKEHAEAGAVIPGDIGAVAKIEEIHHDAVLHDHHR